MTELGNIQLGLTVGYLAKGEPQFLVNIVLDRERRMGMIIGTPTQQHPRTRSCSTNAEAHGLSLSLSLSVRAGSLVSIAAWAAALAAMIIFGRRALREEERLEAQQTRASRDLV
jgi:hypothetical protein